MLRFRYPYNSAVFNLSFRKYPDVLMDVFYKLLAKSDELKENMKVIIRGGYEERDRYFLQIKKDIRTKSI